MFPLESFQRISTAMLDDTYYDQSFENGEPLTERNDALVNMDFFLFPCRDDNRRLKFVLNLLVRLPSLYYQ